MEEIEQCGTMTSLRLEGNTVGVDAAEAIAEALAKHPEFQVNTQKCLSIGTPKAINFPFVSNEKLMFFRSPSIQAHCNEAVIYLNFGTPKSNEFSIWNKWKIY